MVTHTYTHTYTHDNYYNPRCAHASSSMSAAVILAAMGLVLIARAVTQVLEYSLSAALVIDISY